MEFDRLGRDAELLRDELGEHGLVPLTRGPGQHIYGWIARLAELDRRLLLRGKRAARGFYEHGGADASELAAALRLGAPPLEAGPIGVLERPVQITGWIAAIVRGARRCLV